MQITVNTCNFSKKYNINLKIYIYIYIYNQETYFFLNDGLYPIYQLLS